MRDTLSTAIPPRRRLPYRRQGPPRGWVSPVAPCRQVVAAWRTGGSEPPRRRNSRSEASCISAGTPATVAVQAFGLCRRQPAAEAPDASSPTTRAPHWLQYVCYAVESWIRACTIWRDARQTGGGCRSSAPSPPNYGPARAGAEQGRASSRLRLPYVRAQSASAGTARRNACQAAKPPASVANGR
jgi:hypothetical protein